MKNIRVNQVSYTPDPIPGEIIIYGTTSGIGQQNNGESNPVDVVGFTKIINFNDTSPVLIGVAPANITISDINIEIINSFDNMSSIITIGDSIDNSRLLQSDIVNLNSQSNSKISHNPDYKYSVNTDIYAYISGLNTTGQIIVRIYFN
jgi:hypothetical protein